MTMKIIGYCGDTIGNTLPYVVERICIDIKSIT